MILSDSDIKNILDNNPNKDLVDYQKKYNKDMRIHFYGENLESVITRIDGFERDSLRTLRAQYAVSNKDLFERLQRPIDKVFTARGGSIYYNLPESQEGKARQLTSDIGNGISLRQWIKSTAKAHYLDDPGGLILFEIQPQQQAMLLKQLGKSFVYPTYKSSQTIFDYSFSGYKVDYIVFNIDNADKSTYNINDKDGQYFRIIDDSKDIIVKYSKETITLFDELPNYFGQVPAFLCSDVQNMQLNQGVISLFDPIIEQANQFLTKGSIKITHEFMHGFPKYWEYADDCNACGGTGYIESGKCVACKGTGKKIMSKVSDVKLLSYPEKDDTIVTPNVAGYVEPSEIYYNISVNSLSTLENVMNHTLWGKQSAVQAQGVAVGQDTQIQGTATEAMLETKPEADKLQIISTYFEKLHKFAIDMIVKVQVNINYQGSSVSYGNRYMLESPDTLWTNYQTAKTLGATDVALDAMLYAYYESQYFNDPVEQAIKIKLMKVEPSVHLTAMQVKTLGFNDDYVKQKLYFGDWKRSLTQAELMAYTVEQLRDNLTAYIAPIQLPAPQPQLQNS